jgi:argininosuccinate synthase
MPAEKPSSKRENIVKIVLAYSGGLDTSAALHWLRERYRAEVIAFCADIGQPGSMADVERRALDNGATEVIIEDLRLDYLEHYVFPALRANAAYERRYLLAAPLGRPLIARRLVEIAADHGAEAVAHGASGKGNDQVRFYTTAVAHNPAIRVIAPLIEWDLRSRDDELAYVAAHGIEVEATAAEPFSKDGSIWGTSTELGVIDDPGTPPPPEAYQITVAPEDAPDHAVDVTVGFVEGTPRTLDGETPGPIALVERLTDLGGRHGVGRVDIVENSRLGFKARAVYECPAGEILLAAHRELEDMVIDRDTLHHKALVEQRYAEVVYDGLWHSPLRRALDAFVTETQNDVTGEVTLRLYKGNVIPLRRRAARSAFDHSLSTHDETDRYDHAAAQGFSYVWSMPLRIDAMRRAGDSDRGGPPP